MPKSVKKTSPAPPETAGLTIAKKEKSVLTKAQQTFNRLVKKIEKLRQNIEQESVILNDKLDFFAKQIHPLEKEALQLRIKVLKKLYPIYNQPKALNKKDKNEIRDLLGILLENIFAFSEEEPDEEIKEIFKDLEGMSLEEAQKQDAEDMKKQMSDIFNAMGVDLDLNELDLKSGPEELMARLAEMEEKMLAEAEAKEQHKKTRKKTKKQLEKEAREKAAAELKTKSVAGIYKQLAKLFHPDLEPDAGEKIRKEALMKDLTTAYKNNDLHTLLKLELAWINSEEANLEKLTDEKLNVYNEVLKEQVEALEEEAFMVAQHPRFQPLRRFAMYLGSVKFINLNTVKKEITQVNKSLQQTLDTLNTQDPVAEVKTMLAIRRQFRR